MNASGKNSSDIPPEALNDENIHLTNSITRSKQIFETPVWNVVYGGFHGRQIE